MTSEQIRQRSDLLGTQVITRSNGKRLGVVSQLWVDIDRREVVALGLRENILSLASVPQFMRLDRICQIGDVILVDDESVLEDDIDVEAYNSLINSEVITETGELLGRVRGFQFNVETGEVSSIIVASFGLPQIPDRLISTYELPIDEVVSSGPNRLIVFEGAQDRLAQITVGLLEQIGLGTPPWEREEEEEIYSPTARPENQLGTGSRVRSAPEPQPYREPEAVAEEAWDEDEWTEPQPAYYEPAEPVYYEEQEADNWSDVEAEPYAEPEYEEEYEDIEADAWADEEDRRTYTPPKVNIPEKTKMPEYEEEPGF